MTNKRRKQKERVIFVRDTKRGSSILPSLSSFFLVLLSSSLFVLLVTTDTKDREDSLMKSQSIIGVSFDKNGRRTEKAFPYVREE